MDFNQPLMSAVIIPLIFIFLEFILTLIIIYSNDVRQHNADPGKVRKYLVNYVEIVAGENTPAKIGPMNIKQLRETMLNGTKDNESIRVLQPALEQFNIGTQVAFAAISIQFNSILITALNDSPQNRVGLGAILMVFQIVLAVIAVVLRIYGDPDRHTRLTRLFIQVIGSNFIGFAALYIAYIFLAGQNLI